MTTTQTGGGNGAAPDGGSGRKRPTRPGWWWREGNHGPYIEEVDGDQNHAPFLAIDGSNVVDDGSWIAPIPGPAVLAALAEFDRLDALIGGSYEAHADQLDVLRVTLRRSRALSALVLANRAERDGAA